MEKIHIVENAIESDENLKFRYSSKLSSFGNTYLRWKGELLGASRINLVEQRRIEEQRFTKWVKEKPEREAKYGMVLEQMAELYKEVAQYNMADLYFNEAGINGSEIVPFIGKFEKLVSISSRKKDTKALDYEAKRLLP